MRSRPRSSPVPRDSAMIADRPLAEIVDRTPIPIVVRLPAEIVAIKAHGAATKVREVATSAERSPATRPPQLPQRGAAT